MKIKLLKRWKWICLLFIGHKPQFNSAIYRTVFGDRFFCWFIKYHRLYSAIKLECDILGVKPNRLWKKEHPLHDKYAPSSRLRRKSRSVFCCDFDFNSLYPSSSFLSPPNYIKNL